MRLNNNNKIISEDDIIMSDGTSSLSDILSSHQQQISDLKSNVKWIYKYGGVGGSGNPGGGTGPIQPFSIFASLNGIQLKDQSIVLDGSGLYLLSIRINYPNGAQFNTKFTYTTKSSTGGDIKQEQTVILNIENNYYYETWINLNTNSTLQVTASDGNEMQQVGCTYIINPYEFTLTLVDDEDVLISPEHFIETAAVKGVNAKLQYVISVPADISYTYTFLKEEISGTITDKNNIILFPLSKDLFKPENAGYYTVKINFEIIPEGQEKVTLEKNISFSLIPNNLYMLIQPQIGIIYEKEEENPYQYTPGYITFDYRIYEGISQNRSYSVNIKLNGNTIENQSIIERQQYTFKLFSITSGLNTLEIQVSRTSTYTKKYYFYVQQSSITLDWFENPAEWLSYYYRINETTDNFKQYKNQLYIVQSANSQPIKITGMEPPNVSANALINTHIAIGLQYNQINSEDPVIFNFYNQTLGTSPVLSIQQSQLNRLGQLSKLYIRKQSDADKDDTLKYHLIQLYSQYTKKIGNEYYYQISLYIDGILEAVFGQLTNTPLLLDQLQIEPVNCFINLLEVDYKEVTEKTLVNCDYDVYKYYIKYKNDILRHDIGDQLILLEYLKNFVIGINGRITINQADINNIAANIKTPVLIMTYQDDGSFDSRGGFLNALEAGYGEDGTGIGSDMNFQVALSWSSGKNSVEPIQMPSGYSNARFRAALQGSSTKMYRVKNFNLSIENISGDDEGDVYLYSPNFDEENPNTFLPETEFTLKADIVDSSHSNNTSCGRFINTVCRKFSSDIPENGYYKQYIKNCLDGFPTLLFLCHVKQDKITQETLSTYYYLGVYNFNLGRSSYYNLGYKELSIFGNDKNKLLINAGNSFTFFKIPPSKNSLREGLGVAEIQGGDPHFDFSQWDPTVLFQQQESDPRYMFGDIVYGSNSTEQQLKINISKFVEKVAKSGGYLFDFLKKKRGKYETDNVEEGAGYNAEVYRNGQPTGESKNQVPDYTIQYEKYLDKGGQWVFREKTTETIKGTQLDLQDLIIPSLDEGKLASLNYQAASEYYTICMVLGLVDSVMKNLNIKTWNSKPDGTATWYPAFYDMDTCLGINNQGNPITYFAFSDYWNMQLNKQVEDIDWPAPVQIYRDFSPHSLGENGYDVPTNYLFTVAKYAKLIFSDNTSEQAYYLSQYPQELYARWRSNTVNNNTHEGVLKNAESFMDNFFANNIAAICPALVSYNYRSKYLKIASDADTTWVATDYNKFNGTRVNEVRDWLEGRLHILDAYFNLNRSVVPTITYRTERGTWETLMNGSAAVTDVSYNSNYDLANNKDIVILNDIFSANGGQGVQLASYVNFQIKCPEFSPLQIYNQNGSVFYNYLLGGDNKQQIEFTATGTQAIKLGGSQSWTYLSDINWISTSGLYITSEKLENITGSSGKFTSLQLHTPNVRAISLTSQRYSGQLTLDGVHNYPNLIDVNISNSQISLRLNNLNVQTVNLSNMNAPNSSVSITNCNYLKSLNTSKLILRSLQVEGLKGNLKNFTLSGSSINQITVRCGEVGGTFTLRNDSAVTSLSVGDFKTVIIDNCPKLNKIILNRKTIQDIKELQIINCKAANMAITTEDAVVAKKALLSRSSIEKIKLYYVTSLEHIELPDNIELLQEAFKGCSALQTVTANNIKLNTSAFYNCYNFKFRNKNNQFITFTVPTSVTSLQSCFENTSITWEEVRHIINNIPENNAITNVANMFKNCKIIFGLNELKNSITQNNYPNFGRLNKVTNATSIFSTDVYHHAGKSYGASAINKKFMEMGSPNGCSYSNAFGNHVSEEGFYVPIDIFESSIAKIITFPFGMDDYIVCPTAFTDASGNLLPMDTPINLSEIFNPLGLSPSKAVALKYVQPYKDYIFNWENTFTVGWSSLTSIDRVCQFPCNYMGYNNLLRYVPKPVSIILSWAKSNIQEETADYYNMYNWDQQAKLSTIFSGDNLFSAGENTNNCAKYISVDDYQKICDKITKSTSITNINFLFQNVTIVGTMLDWTFGSAINNKIKSAYCTFSNFKNRTNLESINTNYMPLNPDFCKNIPALENVCSMFVNCKFSKPIPFNFFKKRYEETQKVWVKKQEDYIEATLYKYSYSQKMFNLSYLFYNTEWQSDCLQYNPDLYNPPKVRVSDGESEYDTYYIRTLIPGTTDKYQYTEFQIKQNTEITDAEVQGKYIAAIPNVVTNPSLQGDPNRLIVPPDIFYGLLPTTVQNQSVKYAFACKTPLNGIIPKNLLKSNKLIDCSYIFLDQIVIPQLVDTWETEEAIHNIYVHYPSKFINKSSLSNVFNSKYIILKDDNSGIKKIINYSLVLLQDSIPKTTTLLSETFRQSGNIIPGNGQQITTKDHQFNFIGKRVDTEMVFGIDTNYFNELILDKAYYTNYLSVVNGELFTSNTDAGYLNLSENSTNAVMWSWLNHIASTVKLPKASRSIKRLHASTPTVKSYQIPDTNSIKYYQDAKWIVEN